MALELKELITMVSHMQISNVAGKGGLKSEVSWIHMVENIEIAKFLQGRELAFMTGVGLNVSTDLLDLVKCMHKKKVVGLVVNIGPYIEAIPADVIDYCEEYSFPIFTVPWHIHMAEMMRVLSFAIAKAEQNNIELTQAFRNALFLPQQEKAYIPILMKKGYFLDWNYIVSYIEICDTLILEDGKTVYIPISENRIRLLSKKVSSIIRSYSKDANLVLDNNSLILIFPNQTESEIQQTIIEIRNAIRVIMKKQEVLFAGIGRCAKSMRCIAKSFGMAQKIVRMLKIENRCMDVCTNKDIGIYRLLLSIEDKESVSNYLEDTIGPLREYDRLQGDNLTEILQVYLRLNGSVKETSEEFYVHRNTINYKLKKIEGILNADLGDDLIRQEINIAFMMEKIMSMYM